MRFMKVDSRRSTLDRAEGLGAVRRQGALAPRGAARRWAGSLEALEDRLLMHANAAENVEHLAVFGARTPAGTIVGGLVPESSLTIESVAAPAGTTPTPMAWSNPATWTTVVNGVPTGIPAVPQKGDNVLISANSIVTVDGMEDAIGANGQPIAGASNVNALHTIRVDGTLQFATNVNTKVLVDTIIVEPSGTFDVGTRANPVQANVRALVEFADDGAVNSTAPWSSPISPTLPAPATATATASPPMSNAAWDPLQFGRGLVSHGAVSIYGATVTSFVSVPSNLTGGATLVPKGAKSITLPALPTGWQVGDRLVFTGDTAPTSGGANQDEQFAITAIAVDPSSGAATITFGGTTAAAVTVATKTIGAATAGPATTTFTGLAFDHFAPAGASLYLSDVSRNVALYSQNVVNVMDRGHTMFMHNPNVVIYGAGFYGLGRTDKRNPIDDPVATPDTNPTTPLSPTDYIDNAPAGSTVDPNAGKLMTTDVLDAKTGTRVIVPVVDAKGNPVPVTDANGNVVKNPDGTTQYQLQTAVSGLDAHGRYAVHFHRTGTVRRRRTGDDHR